MARPRTGAPGGVYSKGVRRMSRDPRKRSVENYIDVMGRNYPDVTAYWRNLSVGMSKQQAGKQAFGNRTGIIYSPKRYYTTRVAVGVGAVGAVGLTAEAIRLRSKSKSKGMARMLKGHKGQTGFTGKRGNNAATRTQARAQTARTGAKRNTRTKRDEHGRFAGSY